MLFENQILDLITDINDAQLLKFLANWLLSSSVVVVSEKHDCTVGRHR